jgi:hypothetical protein
MDFYKKKRFWILPIGVMCVAVVLCSCRKPGDKGPVPSGVALGGGQILSQKAAGIDRTGWMPFSSHRDANGITTILPRRYTEGIPLVEMRFKKIALDGKVLPMNITIVDLVSPGFGGANYSVGGTGMRLAAVLTRDPNGYSRELVFGKEYVAQAYSIEGVQTAFNTEPLRPAFTVPTVLDVNTVYRVDLILKDEVLESELAAKKEADALKMSRLVEEEKIVVNTASPPLGGLVAVYQVGTMGREFTPDAAGLLVLKGPNKLGGELAVYPRTGGANGVWAYIPKLEKRQVELPKDAQLLADPNNRVTARIAVNANENAVPAGYRQVRFYFSEDTHLPLFGKALSAPRTEGNRTIIAEVPAAPGTYHVRLFGGDDRPELSLGMLKIESEQSKTYVVKIPTGK